MTAKDKEIKKLRAAVELMLPIVEDSFWDYWTAFSMPGAGFNNRGTYKAGSTFGGRWEAKKGFEAWRKEIGELLAHSGEEHDAKG